MYRTFLLGLVTVSALVGLAVSSTPVTANWGSAISMGPTLVLPDLACAGDSSGKAVCMARGTASTPLVNRFQNSGWSGWTALPGTEVVTSSPSCAPGGAGTVLCAARGAKGDLIYTIFEGKKWTAPASAGGSIFSAPSCARFSGKVICAARGVGGNVIAASHTSAGWSKFIAALSFTTITSPSCAADGTGSGICAGVSTAGTIIFSRLMGSSWGPTQNAGGGFNAPLSCITYSTPSGVVCLGRGYDSGIYDTNLGGLFGTRGGVSNSAPSCAATAPTGNIFCAVIGTNNTIFINEFTPSPPTWSGWSSLGGAFIGDPNCIVTGPHAICSAVTVRNRGVSYIGQ